MTVETNELILKNVSFRYWNNEPLVLDNVNLTVKEGEWLTILGRNGSGKSTLARLMNGLLQPTDGQVEAAGYLTNDPQSINKLRQRTAMVFQNPDNQLVAPTVEDDIAFGLENAGISPDEMHLRVQEVIHQLKLTGLEKREPHHLSGGQKQRVAVAGALALKPRIVIFDEATSMLDPEGREEVLALMGELQKKASITIVMITHDIEEAIRSDRIVLLSKGKIVFDGIPHDMTKESTFLERYGIKAPLSMQLANAIRREHPSFHEDVLTEEELVNALCALKQSM